MEKKKVLVTRNAKAEPQNRLLVYTVHTVPLRPNAKDQKKTFDALQVIRGHHSSEDKEDTRKRTQPEGSLRAVATE